MEKLGFIGAGNMATAIIESILTQNILTCENIYVYDVDAVKMSEMKKKGINTCVSAGEVASICDYLLMAVKPQQMDKVLKSIQDSVREDAIIISIAAGVSAQAIQDVLGQKRKIVLVTPNTPLMIGHGSVAMACVPPTTPEEFAFVQKLFSGAGTVEEIDANQMKEVTPLNGSSPAFIYHFAQLFVQEGQAMGFDADVANRLFCHTLIGAARMMLESGKSHEELIKQVCSPGGTTIAGLQAFAQAGLDQAVRCGIEACVARAYELGQKDVEKA